MEQKGTIKIILDKEINIIRDSFFKTCKNQGLNDYQSEVLTNFMLYKCFEFSIRL